VLAVPDYVCELPDPVADNHHAAFAGEHQVEFDMTVAVDEIVDVVVFFQDYENYAEICNLNFEDFVFSPQNDFEDFAFFQRKNFEERKLIAIFAR
jgi:hypothetical protein